MQGSKRVSFANSALCGASADLPAICHSRGIDARGLALVRRWRFGEAGEWGLYCFTCVD